MAAIDLFRPVEWYSLRGSYRPQAAIQARIDLLEIRMRRIRQHGPDRKLFDLKDFIPDVLRFHTVTHWIADVDWCLVRKDGVPDESAIPKQQLSTDELQELYRSTYQTIDGLIIAFNDSAEVARLEAVDSSYWEIDSLSAEFLDFMEDKYGLYEPAPN